MPTPKSALDRAGNNWGEAGLVDANGQPLRPNANTYAGAGDGGGSDMTRRITVEQNVKGLNIAVGALLGGFGLALWFLLGLIDSRFDRADTKITAVAEQVSDLRVEIVTQTSDIKLLLEKQNGSKSQTSEGSGQPSPVREGAPPR